MYLQKSFDMLHFHSVIKHLIISRVCAKHPLTIHPEVLSAAQTNPQPVDWLLHQCGVDGVGAQEVVESSLSGRVLDVKETRVVDIGAILTGFKPGNAVRIKYENGTHNVMYVEERLENMMILLVAIS